MAFDIVEQLRSLTYMDDAAAACQQAADEIVRLRRWKSEATAVIERWEAAWEAAGSPGQLGDAKSDALRDEIVRLRAEVERLTNGNNVMGLLWTAERALADQLAEAVRGPVLKHVIATDDEWDAWQTMRRTALAAYEAARNEAQYPGANGGIGRFDRHFVADETTNEAEQ